MQVTLTESNGLQRTLQVIIPVEDVEQEIDKRLHKLAPQIRVPGFRPGKAPFHVLRQRYEEAVRGEVISELLRNTYGKAIEQENLKPASMPTIELVSAEKNQPVEYKATLEVYPQFTLKDMQNVELQGLKLETTEQNVEDAIQNLLKQYATWAPVTRPAQNGDRVTLDFESTIDGEHFEGGSGQNATLDLGTHSAIPGFEEGLIGATANSTLELDLVFPDDYPNEALRGKLSKSHITLHEVQEATFPELNDEFAVKVGVKTGGVEQLRADIRKNIEQGVQNSLKEHLKEQMLTKLLELNPIDIPYALIEAEAERLKEQAKQYRYAEGVDTDSPEVFISLAKQRVHLGLLFGEFIRAHDMKVDPARVQTALQTLAASSKDPQQLVAWYQSNKEQLAQLESAVLEEQVIDALIQQTKVVDKALPTGPITR